MATQTLATFDAVLKDVYRGPIIEQLNQETYLLDQIERATPGQLGGQSTGRRLIFPVHAGRNRGRGALTDGGTLPPAGKQTYLDAIVPFRYFAQSIELTDMVIRQSQTDEGAFVRALTSETEGAVKDLRKDIQRQVYGTGDGLLASCTATQSAVTFSVDSGQYIAVGDTVDVLTRSNGAVKGSSLTVSAVAYTGTAAGATQANANVTVSSSVSVTAADGVYIAGDRSNETDGLRNIIGTTSRTLHQIDSTTNAFWDANVRDAAFSAPSEDLFMQVAQLARQRSSRNIDVFLTTYGIFRRLANTYTSQKRYNDAQSTKIDGGFSAINVSAGGPTIPVVADVDCPNGWVFGLAKSTFNWAELMKPDWLESPDGKGGSFFLKDGSTAGSKLAIWQAFLGWYATLVNTAPNANAAIRNVYDDVPVARL